MIMTAIVTVAAAYLIGSINFAVIFTEMFLNKDVRNYGSGNAGMTNVMRVAGMAPGVLTFICDMMKGLISCIMGRLIFGYIFTQTASIWALPVYGAYICGAACIIGHVLPLFFQFKGGKGVATAVGIYLACCPAAAGIALAVFLIMVLITKIVSLSSLTAATTVFITSVVFYTKSAELWPQIAMSAVICAVIFIKHKDNILRLIAGEESHISIRKSKT